MNTIITNTIIPKIDFDEINKEFSIIKVTSRENYIKSGSYILDKPLVEKLVCSIKFEDSKNFYLLVKKNSLGYSNIISSLKNSEEGKCLTFEEISPDFIPKYIFIQLLLNNLSNYESELLRFNNLTGHLYCFNNQWIKYKKGENVIWQIPTVEISIDKSFKLLLNVKTFTSIKLKDKIDFSKSDFKKYPHYSISGNNTIKRILESDSNDYFILRQIRNKKQEIPFLDISSLDKFNQSKMGILENIISLFNNKYSGMAEITFDKIEVNNSVEYDSIQKNENKSVINKLLNERKIKIIDTIDNDSSKNFCKEVIRIFDQKYNVKIKEGKRASSNYLNIKVIHNKEYYDGINDPYSHETNNTAIQHITFEDFLSNAEYAVGTIINELMIKKDLIENKISLYDWSKLNYTDDIIFISKEKIKDTDRYFAMTIHPDGTFTISEKILNLFEINEFNIYLNIFESNKNVKGVIKNSKGYINIIENTNMFTIPETSKIKNELENGNNKLRGKEAREKFIYSIIDIKSFEKSNDLYYFVGTIGNGMRQKIETSSVIRRIVSYNNSPIFFNELLQLMNVKFVRNGQLTVKPFPFKYIDEYVRNILK